MTLEPRDARVLNRILLRPISVAQLSRARIVRLAIKGESAQAIAKRLRLPKSKVERRLARFSRDGIDYLQPTAKQLMSRREREEEHYDKVQFHRDLEELLEKNDELLRRLAR